MMTEYVSFYDDLIDTQWNVNQYVYDDLTLGDADLIDTQWNVNIYKTVMEYGGYLRFNRYIVECKLPSCGISAVVVTDLIDTQWNVNSRYT